MSGIFGDVFCDLKVSNFVRKFYKVVNCLLFILQDIMNFTFNIERPKDGEWGILQKNGSWTGMVGMLARQEIDFGTIILKSFKNHYTAGIADF